MQSEKKRRHQFKPGNKLGLGRPKTPQELKELQKEDRFRVSTYLIQHGRLTQAQLEDKLMDPTTTLLERLIGCIYHQAAKGSLQHAKEILDRTIGSPMKVVVVQPEEIKQEGENKPSEINSEKLLAIMLQLKDQPGDEPCKLMQRLPVSSQPYSRQCSPVESPTEP